MSIRFRIFILIKGKRNTISLPSKIGEHNKLFIQNHVEAIKDALEKEVALDQHTCLWIQKIDKDPKAYGVNDLYSKLAKICLIPSRIGNGIQSKFPLIIPANIC